MRVIGLILLLCGTVVDAAPKPYWLCVDARGTKTASDTPCAETATIVRAPSAAERKIPAQP